MTNGQSTKLPVAEESPRKSQLFSRARKGYRLISLFFGGKPVREWVATRVHVEADLKTVWHQVLFYEEIPGRAPLLLRTLIPRPVKTEGGKTWPGALVVCVYESGSLVKRITAFDELQLIEFEVIEQRLGIESCVVARGGSYRFCRNGRGADVELTTDYQSYLHPRWLWRPLERIVMHQFHRHILSGMRETVARETAAAPKAIGASANVSRGEEVCTLQSRSHP